jgi:phosphoserine aminotransferase
MNVVFKLKSPSPELEKKIFASAKSFNIIAIEGHRSVGGFRASLYNAQTFENVQKLVQFLQTFE